MLIIGRQMESLGDTNNRESPRTFCNRFQVLKNAIHSLIGPFATVSNVQKSVNPSLMEGQKVHTPQSTCLQ